MPKVLAQAGVSLADVYDIEGSIAGVDQLLSSEVVLSHEMGGTVFSERLVGSIERLQTGAVAQNTAFDLTLVTPPAGIFRIVAVYVQADLSARTSFVQVSLRDPTTEREIPIFIWQVTNDLQSSIRIVENGGAAGTAAALIQASPTGIPSLGVGAGQRVRVGEEIVCRGLTSGFGAGTVVHTMLIYLAVASVPGLPSVGLPVPGW